MSVTVSMNGKNGQTARVSYRRGDLVAMAFGMLLTVYALGWFVKEHAERMERERTVVPAPPDARRATP
jgi:hypothetical protein